MTPEQLQRIGSRQELIQDIVPQLGAAEREFLLTGYTAENWDAMFPPDEEEDTAASGRGCRAHARPRRQGTRTALSKTMAHSRP